MVDKKTIIDFLPKKSRDVIESKPSITKFLPKETQRIIRSGGGGGRGGASRGGVSQRTFTPAPQQFTPVESSADKQKREATEQKQAQAERRAIDVQEQKQFSQTIAGQVERGPGVQPTTISEFRPGEFGLESGFRRGGFEATRSFVSRLPAFVTGFGPALSRSLEGDPGGFRDIDPFRAFERVGPRRGESVVSFEPQFGTVTADEPTGVRGVTGFDILRQQRREAGIPEQLIGSSPQVISAAIGETVGREIISEFQPRVQRGELTLQQAQQQAEAQFQTTFTGRTAGLEGLGGEELLTRRGERISRQVKGVLPAAAIVGASLTGGAPFVAAAGIGSAGLSLGAGQEALELGREGRFGGATLKLGEAALFGFGSAQLVSGALGPGTSSIFGREITSARLAELRATPFSLGGAELGVGPRGVVTQLSLSRTTGLAAQEADILVPTFFQGTRGAQQQFSIAGGRIRTTTRVQPFNVLGGDPIKFTDVSSFIGKGQTGLGGRLVGPSSAVELGEGITTSIGRITIPQDGKAITTGFGGFSRRGDEFIDVVSARPFRRTLGDISTFSLRGTGAGPIRISSKDLSEFIPSGAQSQSFIGGGGVSGVGGVGGVGGIQGITTSQISGTLPKTQDLVTGGVQAGFTAAEVTGVPALQQAGIQSFLPSFRTPAVRGGGLSFGTLAQPQQTFQLARQDFSLQSSLARVPDTFNQLTTIDTTPITAERLATGLSISPSLRQRGDLSLRRGQASLVSTDLASVVDVAQISEQRLGLETKQQQRLSQQFQQQFSAPSISPARGRFAEGIGLGFVFGGVPFGLPTFGEPFEPRRRTKGKKRRPGRVAPSLTGQTLFDLGDITGGALPTSGLPSPRLVPESFVTRRKKTTKKKVKKKTTKTKTSKKKK